MSWPIMEVRSVALEDFDERLRRYRLLAPSDQRQMEASLRRDGQISPVVACLRDEEIVLIDGFKRLTAARALRGFTSLSTRLIEVDEHQAKAAMYRLNLIGRAPQELEEAWIVQSLVHDDGLSQVAVASLLGRHKSWVCRRLALLEKLCEEARNDLQVGLLTPTQGRQLVRLPRGNQAEALHAARRDALSSRELQSMVDLLLASGTPEKRRFVLEKPRQAIQQASQEPLPAWDPRLSAAGNRVCRQLARLLDGLAAMETWLVQRGRSELADGDFRLLQDPLERLVRQARAVAEHGEAFLQEMTST
ncbi:MAG TPA: hypothetical protein ENJ16_01185 [Planctomycetaceae bacterium]|nr:hypothetical protein [Planctomycetaceae bacterium]